MERAEDYLWTNLAEPFSLTDFAAATGTNHRTLQRYFRSVYGVTPQVWFRSMKLNAIHRELQQTNGTGERISDIAIHRACCTSKALPRNTGNCSPSACGAS